MELSPTAAFLASEVLFLFHKDIVSCGGAWFARLRVGLRCCMHCPWQPAFGGTCSVSRTVIRVTLSAADVAGCGVRRWHGDVPLILSFEFSPRATFPVALVVLLSCRFPVVPDWKWGWMDEAVVARDWELLGLLLLHDGTDYESRGPPAALEVMYSRMHHVVFRSFVCD